MDSLFSIDKFAQLFLDKRRNLVLNLNPVNLNRGIDGLTQIARTQGFDLENGVDTMIFVSKSRKLLKLVGYDEIGPFMLTRKLARGSYQKILDRVEGTGTLELTITELELYLDGERIRVDPSRC